MFRPTERLLGEALRNTMVNIFISLVSGLIGETELIKTLSRVFHLPTYNLNSTYLNVNKLNAVAYKTP